MKPTTDELAHAIIAIAAEPFALPDVSPETFHRLAALGYTQWNAGEWELTAAGKKIFRVCLEGEDLTGIFS